MFKNINYWEVFKSAFITTPLFPYFLGFIALFLLIEIIIPLIVKKYRKHKAPATCPKCGGLLRQRKGDYGMFVGCENYPNCRYTRKSV